MFTGNLLHLLHLCDTALPIGGFAHSAGLETYVQERVVHDRKTAKDFTTQQLSYNICYTDAALVSLAFNAAANKNIGAVIHLDELCNAVKLAKEMRLASK